MGIESFVLIYWDWVGSFWDFVLGMTIYDNRLMKESDCSIGH